MKSTVRTGEKLEEKTSDEVEKDKGGSEDTVDVDAQKLKHLPANALHDTVQVVLDGPVCGGWVKQPSPCCCAATLAGAWNAVTGLGRHDKHSLATVKGVEVLERLMKSKIEAATNQLRKVFRGADVTPLLRLIEEFIKRNKLVCGGTSSKLEDQPATSWLVGCVTALGEALGEGVESHPGLPAPDNKTVSDEWSHKELVWMVRRASLDDKVFQELRDLCSQKEAELPQDPDEAEGNSGFASDSSAGSTPADTKGVTFTVGFGGKGLRKNIKWKAILTRIFRNWNGLGALKNRPSAPSTAAFGNWGLLEGAPLVPPLRLGDMKGHRLTISHFAKKRSKDEDGKKAKEPKASPRTLADGPPVPISEDDSEEEIEKQWSQVKQVISENNTCLIFHLKNHYALVYGYREGMLDNGKPFRQILTARSGQRPRHWIDWDEARATVLSWKGYGLMKASLEQPLQSGKLLRRGAGGRPSASKSGQTVPRSAKASGFPSRVRVPKLYSGLE